MTFQIIPITEQYVYDFAVAVNSVARERKYLAFLEGPPMQMTKDFVYENIKGGWPHVIAILKNKVIGWCDISSLHRPVFLHSGTLGIGVIKECRGQGIGESLITSALSLAKDKGLTRIELTVREDNKRAIALYQKIGFVIEGVHQNSVFVDGHYENQIFMALLW